MTEYFTPNDLIRYVYQEMDEVESEMATQALRNDEILMQDYLDMLSTLEQLDHLILQPSDKVVNAIKKRSKSSGLEKV
ncbi:MAG TPA: hypothetical protein VKZ51_06130 [Cyclobacteriaceae bacterium]|nr:hypothetical protein [Cyclobacteriaceae bacterium]